MKALALFALALWCAFPLKADTNILANSDFSNGKANWKGDGQDASAPDITDVSVPLDNSGSVKGMIITLGQGYKTISQDFSSPDKTLTFSMTYKTSPDYQPDSLMGSATMIMQSLLKIPLTDSPGPGMPPRPPGMPPSMPFGRPQGGSIPKNSALVAIADLDQNTIFYSHVSVAAAGDSTTVTCQITGLLEHAEKTLYVVFPSGTGTITFSNISLTKPDESTAAPSDNPFDH